MEGSLIGQKCYMKEEIDIPNSSDDEGLINITDDFKNVTDSSDDENALIGMNDFFANIGEILDIQSEDDENEKLLYLTNHRVKDKVDNDLSMINSHQSDKIINKFSWNYTEYQTDDIRIKSTVNEQFDDSLECTVPEKLYWLKEAKVVLQRLPISMIQKNEITKFSRNHTEYEVSKKKFKNRKTHITSRIQIKNLVKKKELSNFVRQYCEYCDEIVQSDINFKNDKRCPKCKTKLQMQCMKCDQVYDHYPTLVNHLKKSCYQFTFHNYTANIDICTNCGKKFEKHKSFVQHVKFCGQDHEYVFCEYCSFKTKYKQNMKNHVHSHMMENRRYNKYIDIKQKWIDGLSLIEQKNIEYYFPTVKPKGYYLPYFMRYCPQCKVTVANTAFHSSKKCQTCTTTMRLQCRKCDKRYDNYHRMMNHLKNVCQARAHRCDKCGQEFGSYYKMMRHLKRMHSDDPRLRAIRRRGSKDFADGGQACEACGKMFISPDAYKSHTRWCGRADVFCDHCPFRTKYRHNLICHIRRHLQWEETASYGSYAARTKRTNKAKNYKIIGTDKRLEKPTETSTGTLLQYFNRYCPQCDLTVLNTAFKNFSACKKCKKNMMLQCRKCNNMYLTYAQLMYHIKDKCQPEIHLCLQCDLKFDSYYKMARHLRSCTENIKLNSIENEYKKDLVKDEKSDPMHSDISDEF